ncbi:MAG: histidine kinase [Bacteroidota bacterium]|nr:histidine kinase [Bacteroidota bacterium]
MDRYPFIFSDERKYRLRRHFWFWFLWWLFQTFLYAFIPVFDQIPYRYRFLSSGMNAFFFLIPHLFLAYSLIYLVVPQLLLKGKYLVTAISVLLLFLATAAISAFISIYLLDNIYAHLQGRIHLLLQGKRTTFFMSLLAGLRGAITIGGMAAAIKLMKYWYVKEQRNLQLQKENVEAQLQLLKAQVHPHFLFNTLNNIYSFTQNTSPTAARLVSGLSDLLRYILYEGNQFFVPLHKELKMLQDYIMLEKVRYGNQLEVHLDLPSETNNLQIAPLLLLPLVENCFKHGTSTILEHPWISLHLTIEEKEMQLKLVNGKAVDYRPAKPTTGIGLQNVRKRLELLYPDKYTLKITDEEEIFIVDLKLLLEGSSIPTDIILPNTTTPVHA